jgi:excisionase family DNA binding protein
MSDLLTTRQLQNLLHIDRITVYRMLKDGRLPGFKVGGQWRFSRQEIEKWLQKQRTDLEVTEWAGASGEPPISSHVLPLSCVQPIQSLCAEALDIAAVTTDPDGTPLTTVSNSCAFCNLILATKKGQQRCSASWMPSDGNYQSSPPIRVCHAGLLCASVPVQVQDRWVANVAGCQFVARSPDGAETWLANLPALADDLGLSVADLQVVADSVRRLPEAQLSRIPSLLQRVADTFAEMGRERLGLIDRLRRIAEMTEL